ncbi:unnamed protein product [Amoebophrya sp. A120]|nr:unnamed protein product [Amoebophrya sp. A120]|eukprot:GSA120T00009169001.1
MTEEKKKEDKKPREIQVMDTEQFLPMFNTYLEKDFSEALHSYADEYAVEFRRLINEQVASQNFETHKHRYHDLFGVFHRAIEKSLVDFCHSRRFPHEDFEATIDQYLDVKSDEEDEAKKSKGIDLECKRLLKAFIASTEYQAFMEFMVEYVGEMEESDFEEILC